MESVEVAKLKPGQTLTLEFGNREAVLTKLEEPGKFKMEDWLEDETEVYILEPVIEEDEPLHWSTTPLAGSLEDALKEIAANFGVNRPYHDFLGRVVDGIEMEEEEEEGEEEAAAEGEEP